MKKKARIAANLRRKLRYEVKREFEFFGGINTNAAGFLYWLAQKNKIKNRKKFHIDHLIPLKAFNLKSRREKDKANSPYNLRWLKRLTNQRKNAKMPGSNEINEHFKLVNIWIKENHNNTKLALEILAR